MNEATVGVAEEFSFEYTNLQDIDPSAKPIEEGVYELRVSRAELVAYTNDRGSGKRLSFAFTVDNHPKYLGRKLFDTMFPSEVTFKILRLIMDATGVVQERTETLETWCKKLVEEGANFKVPVSIVLDQYKNKQGEIVVRSRDIHGNPAPKNKIEWFRVQAV